MMLERAKIHHIAFDYVYAQVRAGKSAGHSVEFGDVSNPQMQGAAALAKAKLVAVMLEDHDRACRLAEQLRGFYPALPIYVAVGDLLTRDHLRQLGIFHAITTYLEGNLILATEVLTNAGLSEEIVHEMVEDFRKDGYALLRATRSISSPGNAS